MVRQIERKRSAEEVNPKSLPAIVIPPNLRQTLRGDNFLAHDSGPSDDKLFFIFTTEDNLNLLETCNHWHADGTFKCCPQLFYQVYTIHGVLNNHTLLLVSILLTRKTEALYARALTDLKEINPCLSPKVVTVNFELAANNAFSKVFPGVKPKGCFFLPFCPSYLEKNTG